MVKNTNYHQFSLTDKERKIMELKGKGLVGLLLGLAGILIVMACGGMCIVVWWTMPAKGNLARRANEVTLSSSRGKETWSANDRNADVVCLIQLNGTISVSDFNAAAKEKKYAMTGGKKREFMMTQATTENGLFGKSERVTLIFVVSKDDTKVTLHLGNLPPIELDAGSKIAEKIQINE